MFSGDEDNPDKAPAMWCGGVRCVRMQCFTRTMARASDLQHMGTRRHPTLLRISLLVLLLHVARGDASVETISVLMSNASSTPPPTSLTTPHPSPLHTASSNMTNEPMASTMPSPSTILHSTSPIITSTTNMTSKNATSPGPSTPLPITVTSNATTESAEVHCNFSQLCANQSVYYWMVLAVDVTGDLKNESDISGWFRALFHSVLDSCEPSNPEQANGTNLTDTLPTTSVSPTYPTPYNMTTWLYNFTTTTLSQNFTNFTTTTPSQTFTNFTTTTLSQNFTNFTTTTPSQNFTNFTTTTLSQNFTNFTTTTPSQNFTNFNMTTRSQDFTNFNMTTLTTNMTTLLYNSTPPHNRSMSAPPYNHSMTTLSSSWPHSTTSEEHEGGNMTAASLFQDIEVTCVNKTGIRRTNCTVLLRTRKPTFPCCLQRALVLGQENSSIQTHIVGNRVERVGKGLCAGQLPPSNGFAKCTGFLNGTLPLPNTCHTPGPVNISCGHAGTVYVPLGNQTQMDCGMPPKPPIDSEIVCNCSSYCYGTGKYNIYNYSSYCYGTAAYYTLGIQIKDPTMNISKIFYMIDQLKTPPPCNNSSETHPPCPLPIISTIYQDAHVECNGANTNLQSCRVIVRLNRSVPICAVSTALMTVFNDKHGIGYNGTVTRAAICGYPGSSGGLLNSTFTWESINLNTTLFCEAEKTTVIVSCKQGKNVCVLLNEMCDPMPPSTSPSPMANTTLPATTILPPPPNVTIHLNTPYVPLNTTLAPLNTTSKAPNTTPTAPNTTIAMTTRGNTTTNSSTPIIPPVNPTTASPKYTTTAVTTTPYVPLNTTLAPLNTTSKAPNTTPSAPNTTIAMTTQGNTTTNSSTPIIPPVNPTTASPKYTTTAVTTTPYVPLNTTLAPLNTTSKAPNTTPSAPNTTIAMTTQGNTTTNSSTPIIPPVNPTTASPKYTTTAVTTTTAAPNTTAASSEEQANQLLDLTSNVSKLNSSQVDQLVSQLEALLAGPNVSLGLGKTSVKIVSNLLGASSDTLASSSTKIIGIVDTVGLKLVVQQEATILTKSVAVAIKTVDGTNFQQTSFSIPDPNNVQIRGDGRARRSVRTEASSLPQGSVTFPSSLTANLSHEQQLQASRLQFNFYQKATVFQDRALGDSRLYSGILGASVANLSIKSLQQDVVITLRNTEPVPANVVVSCVFWDFGLNDGSGGWNRKGCSVRNSTENETVCACNHLTSFGVLLDISRTGITNHLQATILTYITYIGCGISAIFLSVTLLTYLAFGKLRKDIPSKILIQLCVALLFLNLVFLVDAWLALYPDAVGLCISTAWFLHYFLLASFTWMGLEAVHMYLALVKVFNTYIKRYMLKFSLVGWGVPLLVVIVVIAVDKNNYGLVSYGKYSDNSPTDDFCWLKNNIAFYVSVVAYFCVIFLLNLSMFVMVMVQLCRIKSQNPHNMRHRNGLQDLRSVVGITLLLGLTWGFAFFAWGPVNLAFMYLFAIFNSFQGFFIFVFHCAVKENVRRQWRTYLCCGRLRLAENSDWSRTATQKTEKKSLSVTRATSFRSGNSSQFNHTSSSSFLTGDSPERPSGATGSLFDDRTITALEELNSDVVLNEVNSQFRTQS
ncbi:mucin-5AC-like isoform X36 [Oncorhynchus keta]|uniref:mucin-5AC-like isoform X36 n=1 Tax=Oncorhynchus keta TaxID=8018 RepID=UPI00227D1CF4|nr:mucin-5AC-like isoform X36 [Oncorhynchus keta]